MTNPCRAAVAAEPGAAPERGRTTVSRDIKLLQRPSMARRFAPAGGVRDFDESVFSFASVMRFQRSD